MQQIIKNLNLQSQNFQNLLQLFQTQNRICIEYSSKYRDIQPIYYGQNGPQLTSNIVSQQFSKQYGFDLFFNNLKRKQSCMKSSQEINFLKNLHNQKHNNTSILCCITAFYNKQKLLNHHQADLLEDFQVIKSVKKIDEGFLKQTFVAFLNSYKGGVILFDVKKHLTNFIVEGTQMTQFQKQKIQDKIISLFQCISPSVVANKHYEFSYVPVMISPLDRKQNQIKKIKQSQNQKQYQYSSSDKSSQKNSKKQFKKGYFVLRIRVQSPDPNITYHIGYNTQNYIYTRKNHSNYELKEHQIYNFIKDKYLQGLQMPTRDIRNHNHPYLPITTPQRGYVIYGEQNQMIQKKEIRYNFEYINLQYEKQYRHLSLIIVDFNNIHKVVNICMKQKIRYQIRQTFPQNKFKLSSSTYMVYHDIKFDKLKSYIDPHNLTYCNNSKKIKLLSTTKCLQTIFIDQVGIQNLTGWLKMKFPNQNLKIQVKGKQTILMTQSYISSINLELNRNLKELETQAKEFHKFLIQILIDQIIQNLEKKYFKNRNK